MLLSLIHSLSGAPSMSDSPASSVSPDGVLFFVAHIATSSLLCTFLQTFAHRFALAGNPFSHFWPWWSPLVSSAPLIFYFVACATTFFFSQWSLAHLHLHAVMLISSSSSLRCCAHLIIVPLSASSSLCCQAPKLHSCAITHFASQFIVLPSMWHALFIPALARSRTLFIAMPLRLHA